LKFVLTFRCRDTAALKMETRNAGGIFVRRKFERMIKLKERTMRR
jgi:hypothetical protein